MTAAVAHHNKREEAELVQAGLSPLFLLSLLAITVAIPALWLLPLPALFGRVGTTAVPGLRVAALIAMAATLLALPASGVNALRQAYQELHVTILVGTAANFVTCVGLLAAAKSRASLTIFVGIFTLPPMIAGAINFAMLLRRRSYLLRVQDFEAVKRRVRHLLGDGISYLGLAFSNIFVYQWPIYWFTRHRSAAESSLLAITMQLCVLCVGIMSSMTTPLWSTVADASARADHEWLRTCIKKAETIVASVGAAIAFIIGMLAERLVRIWVGKPIVLDWPTRWLIGAYVALAAWEWLHINLILGTGRLRILSMTVLKRVVPFAIAVPVLTASRGIPAVWGGLVLSIALWSSWKLPRILRTVLPGRGSLHNLDLVGSEVRAVPVKN